MGTADTSWQQTRLGPLAGMVWQQLGILQTFVAEVNSSLVVQTWKMVATPVSVEMKLRESLTTFTSNKTVKVDNTCSDNMNYNLQSDSWLVH